MTPITSNQISTKAYAQKLDDADELKSFRSRFHFPIHQGEPCVYFCGNSLGLQPKTAESAIQEVMESWKTRAVEGHFTGNYRWIDYHKLLAPSLAKIVGALEDEVVPMNTLTVNLHLMMVSFYQPKGKRYKILMEPNAFPSDQYAVASQVKFHGYSPEDAIVTFQPREGEKTLRMEDMITTIEHHKDELALIMLGGVNYYTGQYYPLAEITEAAHKAGALVGFDLAHAVGNVPLKLHNWEVDFAVWCTYKYLNSSPGGVSGVFVHEKHAKDNTLNRFAGWWGHKEDERFLMDETFVPMEGAEGWQLSNAPMLIMAAHRASLALFDEAGMHRLIAKSKKLTAYLEQLVKLLDSEQDKVKLDIITPADETQRGCQLSLVVTPHGKAIFDAVHAKGVIGDWREPDVIRVAPVPMYNSFNDVLKFYTILKEAIQHLN